jgi:Tol biopolymer transport system component
LACALAAATLAVVVLAAGPAGAAPAPTTERVSVTSAEAQASGDSGTPWLSTDGRYVVFASLATDLITDDTNAKWDIFIRDRALGTTERVSVTNAEAQANGHSNTPVISADGRYVAFVSSATNLVSGDTNGKKDVFVRDRLLETTVRVSRSTGGAQGNGDSSWPSISADGRYVAFESSATNLVAGDTNGKADVFVRDLIGQTTIRVSLTSAEVQGSGTSMSPSISADGRYVAFTSASALVTGDTNGKNDVYVRDRTAGTTERVSLTYLGGQTGYATGPSISADGRYVAFWAPGDDLVADDTNGVDDVFVRDRVAGTTERVSLNTDDNQGNGASHWPAISANGRYVAFYSDATNLTADSNLLTDVFVRDREMGTTRRASMSSGSTQGNGVSDRCVISADGMVVAFESDATNLVAGDTNSAQDIFVRVTTGAITYLGIRGSDRYDTAIRLSRAVFPSGPMPSDEGIVLAPGETFQEALCGAPLAAAWGGVVLLTPSTGLRADVAAEIDRLSPEYVFCIGLSDAIVTAVKAVVPVPGNVTAIRGANVYEMSRLVAYTLDKAKDLTGATALITIGTNFPDALGLAPLACGKYWPIILTDKTDGSPLHADAATALADLGITQALKVGTYATLPVGVTQLGNLSGGDRYETNVNVVVWALANTGLTCSHIGVTTGQKFPDALAAGPYLQHYDESPVDGLLFLSPLSGPLPQSVAACVYANRAAVTKVSFVACIEPVISLVKALLP